MAETLSERIIELLGNEPEGLYSISDIAKRLGVAYSHAHSFVNDLIKTKIIEPKRIGRTIICRLNKNNPLTISALSTISYKRTAEWMKRDARSEKILERIEMIKDDIHTALLHGNKVVLVVPTMIKGVDFSIIKNRSVITFDQLRKNKKYYKDCILLYGAEVYWRNNA